jgi:prepilin peptidase CpaA
LSYVPTVVQIPLVLLVIAAAILDFRTRRIPNWLTLLGVIMGLGLNTFLHWEDDRWMSFKGLGIAFALYFPLFLLRAMGAGDVKLMAAVGAFAGWRNWLAILVVTSIFGGIAAVVLIASKGRFAKTLQNIQGILVSARHLQAPYADNPQLDVRSEQGLRLPHGVAIAFGTLAFLIAASIWAPR